MARVIAASVHSRITYFGARFWACTEEPSTLCMVISFVKTFQTEGGTIFARSQNHAQEMIGHHPSEATYNQTAFSGNEGT